MRGEMLLSGHYYPGKCPITFYGQEVAKILIAPNNREHGLFYLPRHKCATLTIPYADSAMQLRRYSPMSPFTLRDAHFKPQ